MKFFSTIFISLFLFLQINSAFAASEKPAALEIVFPLSETQTDWLAPSLSQKNVIGTKSAYVKVNLPLRGRVKVVNLSERALAALELEITLGPSLQFAPTSGGVKDPNFIASKKIISIETVLPQAVLAFDFEIRRPSSRDMTVSRESSFLKAGLYQGSSRELIASSDRTIIIQKPAFTWAPLALIALCLTLIAALIFMSVRSRLLKNFTTYELVTLAVFTSFYVLGSFLSGFIRSLGISSLFMHFIWAVYSWMVLLTLVRLVPKPGSTSVLMVLGALVTGMLIFGIDPIMFLTFTIPGALALELWFAMSGYGRGLVSALGSGICYAVFPMAFYWLVVTPVFYSLYYTPGFTWFWVIFNFVVYLLAAFLGHRAANYFEKVIH